MLTDLEHQFIDALVRARDRPAVTRRHLPSRLQQQQPPALRSVPPSSRSGLRLHEAGRAVPE